MGKVIACVNEKGGVGKSTVVKNLSAGLVRNGKKVLVIDIDPSASLTKMFGMQSDEETGTILDILDAMISMTDELPEKFGILQQKSRFEEDAEPEGMDIITSSSDLNSYQTNVEKAMQRELLLDRYLENVRGDYDYILIDSPGGLGVYTENALFAADSVLIPTKAEAADIESMQNVFEKIALIRRLRRTNGPEIMGILFNMVQLNTNNDRSVMENYQNSAGKNVHFFKTYIPRLVKVKESDIPHQSVFRYAEKSQAAMLYGDFVNEFLELEKSRRK